MSLLQTFPSSNESRLCPGAHCQFAFYGGESSYHQALLGLQIFNVFMFFWLANFVLALGQVTLAGAFASYYWALNKPGDLPAFPLFSAFGRALRWDPDGLGGGSGMDWRRPGPATNHPVCWAGTTLAP